MTTRIAIALTTAAAMFGISSAHAAVVAAASGPSAAHFTPGAVIAANTGIRLVAGDTLVLADGARTRTLRGPGQFTASEARTQLASIIDLEPAPRVHVVAAAVRGGMGRDTLGLVAD